MLKNGLLWAFTLLFAFSSAAHGHGGNAHCLAALHRSSDAETAFNAFMSKKYPKLAFMLSDPDAFLARMRARFRERLETHPDSPHHFDYSEVGMPLMIELEANLERKIRELGESTSKKIGEDEKRVAIQYLSDLRAEARQVLAKGTVSYRHLIEFCYFYSRAIGHFDTRFYGRIVRAQLEIDRAIEGYRQMSIEQEYNLYKDRRFSVFQRRSVSKGFRATNLAFEEAFADREYLHSIWIPTSQELERDVFMRLMFKDVHLVGVTYEPIMADGFLRPGGDFWMHDVRHEAAKFYEKWRYIREKGLTPQQIEQLDKQTDLWAIELNTAISKVKDHDLQDALDMLAFSFHHDRGYPLIPSVYVGRDWDSIVYMLYFAMRFSDQGVPFKNPLLLEKADRWLRKFWANRLKQEERILQGVAP